MALAVAAPAEPRASAGIPWLGTPVQAFQPSPMLYLARSAAVSPDGTILYVVDSQFGFVREYATKTGAYLGSWGWPGSKPGQFNDPRGIAVDPYGDVWVADTGNGRVQKFSRNGTFLLSFDFLQPIGVAAAPVELYVLSGLFRSVGVRSWSGKDWGGFVATFAKGYSPYGKFYGAPTTTLASGIAADPQGNAVVSGTVSQPLVGPSTACQAVDKSTALPPLPDPLVAPALGRFDDKGGAGQEDFPFNAGAICWTDSVVRWSYGLTGRHGGSNVAVDPATGVAYTVVSEQPYHVESQNQEPIGIWDPSQGQTANPSGLATVSYGPIRAFAIGCDSALYLVTDLRILRYPSSSPNNGLCKIRTLKSEATLSVLPALGGAPPIKHPASTLAVGAACRSAAPCKAKVSVAFLPCPRCRPLAVVRRLVRLAGGTAKPMSLELPGPASRHLASGRPLVASLRVGNAPPTSFPVGVPTAITASCSGGLAVRGTVSPARPGLRVRVAVAGPSGRPLFLSARTDGRGRYGVRAHVGDGAWTALAHLAGTAALASAEASCTSRVGKNPGPVGSPPPPGRDIRDLELTLSCPASGEPGKQLTVSGRLSPHDAGVAVALTAGGEQQTATTDGNGAFSARFTPAAAGELAITARTSVVGVSLERSCSVRIAKAPPPKVETTLTLSCPAGAVPWPGAYAFTGTLTPAVPGATVAVTFTSPGQAAVTRTGDVTASGSYSVTFSPPVPGAWSAKASWPGDATHLGASSLACTFMVG